MAATTTRQYPLLRTRSTAYVPSTQPVRQHCVSRRISSPACAFSDNGLANLRETRAIRSSARIEIRGFGLSFQLDRELLIARSGRIATTGRNATASSLSDSRR